MAVWDLANLNNWRLILSEQKVVQNRKTLNSTDYTYEPIPDFFVAPNSHLLLIGALSNSAKKHWFLGARASQYLYISPSANYNFTSGVRISDEKKIRLKHLNLVEFTNYKVLPYVLRLEIPYWLEDIHIEAWEYQGASTPTNDEYEFLFTKLNIIEDKVDNILNRLQGVKTIVNFSTGFDNPDSSGSLGII